MCDCMVHMYLCIRVRVKDRERREELRELKEAHQNTLKAKNDENVRSSLIALRQLMLRCNRVATALQPRHDASQRSGERVDPARPLVIGILSLILDAQSVRW